MSSGAWMMTLASLLALGALLFLIVSLARSIVVERSGERSVWREFGLGLFLAILFFATWVGHGIAEWQTYTDSQREHGQPITGGDFFAQFAQSTLENWQSEFLQLFAFVVLAALYIHKGSAESKDGEENIEWSGPSSRDRRHPWTHPPDRSAPRRTRRHQRRHLGRREVCGPRGPASSTRPGHDVSTMVLTSSHLSESSRRRAGRRQARR